VTALRLLVADSHYLVRLGLRSFVESHDGWQVCGEAVDGRDAVEKCKRLKPDLLILDICMPKLNGVDAARRILRAEPNQRILIVTDVESEDVIRECLEVGVRGWVRKSDGAPDLLLALEALQKDRRFFTPHVEELVLNDYLQKGHRRSAAPGVARLSSRERELVQLISEGNITKQVATIMNVTAKTAETHRSNVMRKLGVHSIAELVLYAVRNNIVKVQLPTAPLAETKTVYHPADILPPGIANHLTESRRLGGTPA
jgi:DNA-binding NarL/FixJ family response regulator